MTNITLEQLRVFLAVAERGGVNAAADTLYRSPSTISHALRKLQDTLELTLFEPSGRNLRLTENGKSLLKQARLIMEENQGLITLAQHLKEHERGELSLAVDAICPHALVLDTLDRFAARFPHCNIKLYEGVLSGSEERFLRGEADVCIAYRVPPGFLGEKFMDVEFVPVVNRGHPCAERRTISARQLMRERQVVISDSGFEARVDSGWLKSAERWTVSSMATAIVVIASGMAFGWVPRHMVREELQSGEFKELSLEFGGEKSGGLYLTVADADCAMTRELVVMLRNRAAED